MSALKLGQARGVILQTAQKTRCPVDYSPNEIKKAVSGLGMLQNQVQFIKTGICLKEIPETDAADAIAVAVAMLLIKLLKN